MDLVIVHPEIPQNTGTSARLAAAIDVALHLVEPIGFSLDSKYLKRAGLDYWPDVEMHVHGDWNALVTALEPASPRPFASRLRLFTARGGSSLFEVAFEADDILVFGSESKGLPGTLLETHASQRVRVPTLDSVRSLNLANVVCLGAYVALDRTGTLARFETRE
ncbi:MAG: tRNA (cytidine(34)-2'-O)-methyltransferase [Myxococcota bacterium]|nr:tRNA (cytidine(34)-2'-O)-methyltransferase [Myxococcota bacterium]